MMMMMMMMMMTIKHTKRKILLQTNHDGCLKVRQILLRTARCNSVYIRYKNFTRLEE